MHSQIALPVAVCASWQAGEDEAAHTVSREIDGTKLILASPLMHRFMRMVDRVAGHTESVLITGETGTGKELIARTIHQSSHRRSRPWVDINCAALPENLVESELFGYEKGAFSGADASKPGLFEMVGIKVNVAERMNELADPEPCYLRHHFGEERIGGDVERHAQEHIG